MRFAVVDIETTGGIPKRDRIIEIAVAVYENGKIVSTFESLVKPDVAIPAMITDLTGIRNDMVAHAPRFHDIARAFVEITEGCVFVAHNVRFDYGFICEEFNRLGYRYQRKVLCTCLLSRKLMPHLPRHNLDTLIQAHGIWVPPEKRHRAMGDVAATVEIFGTLLGLDTDREAVDAQLNQGVRSSNLPPGITIEQLHALPETCGVYYFHNEFGDVVYVGKSINIKKRVMQHFADRTAKEIKLQQSVRGLSYEELGSELIALLYESQEIKRLQPLYNRAQRKKNQPYGIFLTENAAGCHALFVAAVQAHKKRTPIKRFLYLEEARGSLHKALRKFELCEKLVHLDEKQSACSLRRIGQCKGACDGTESPSEYNQRVSLAVESLSSDFPEEMVIVENGRSASERSFVLIEMGRFQGHGYFDEGDSPTLEDLRSAMCPGIHHSDLAAIVAGYLAKHPMVRKIKLSNRFERL